MLLQVAARAVAHKPLSLAPGAASAAVRKGTAERRGAETLSPTEGFLYNPARVGKQLWAGKLDSLVPGALVRHPTQPDWGLGQVQSVAGRRVTVNFEDRGKVVVMTDKVDLEVVAGDPRG